MTKNHALTSLALFLSFTISILLSACGGNSSSFENGVGGTGITQGRITHLESNISSTITINEIQFDTKNASFIRDGETTESQSDFSIGEIITIKGSIKADNAHGIATEVIFDDTVEGPITAIINENTIEVLGQTIEVDSGTIFYGFNQLADLKRGFIVEVSGYVKANDRILASTLKLLRTTTTIDSTLQIKGHISDINLIDRTFKINNLLVDYSTALVDEEKLKPDVYVLVRSVKPLIEDVLIASKVIILNGKLDSNKFYKKSGYITKIDSQDSFEFDGIPVLTQLNTVFLNGSKSDLNVNKNIIISGFTNSEGTLLADEIYLIDRRSQILLEGFIDSIITTDNKKIFSVLGADLIIDDVTDLADARTGEIININLDQFNIGNFIYVEAYNRENNNEFNALYLSKVPELLVRTMSVVKSTSSTQESITLYSHHKIIVDSLTEYFDVFTNPVSKTTFFSQLKNEETLIDVIGLQATSNSILASAIYIDTSW